MRQVVAVASLLLALSTSACGGDERPPGATTGAGQPAGAARGGGPPPGKGPAAQTATTTVPAGVAGTTTVAASGESVAAAVEEALGPEVEPGQPTVIGASCEGGDCVLRYRSGPRGGGHVLDGLADALSKVFADRSVKRVVAYVHHKQVGTPEKNEAPAFATATCRRSDDPRLDWAALTGDQVPRRCRYTHEAGGKLRSLIKRGELSTEDASRGKTRSKGDRGPQGKPGGRPAGEGR